MGIVLHPKRRPLYRKSFVLYSYGYAEDEDDE